MKAEVIGRGVLLVVVVMVLGLLIECTSVLC